MWLLLRRWPRASLLRTGPVSRSSSEAANCPGFCRPPSWSPFPGTVRLLTHSGNSPVQQDVDCAAAVLSGCPFGKTFPERLVLGTLYRSLHPVCHPSSGCRLGLRTDMRIVIARRTCSSGDGNGCGRPPAEPRGAGSRKPAAGLGVGLSAAGWRARWPASVWCNAQKGAGSRWVGDVVTRWCYCLCSLPPPDG